MRILLAEDDFDDCELFADALDEINCGADLKTVNDGEQLINFLTHCMERLPSVLFLDLNMPGLDVRN